jgi:hypothetical protein
MFTNRDNLNKNPNIEIRNPKQYQNPNVLNSKQKRIGTAVFCFGHWHFGHLNLFRVSIFEFRISPSIK